MFNQYIIHRVKYFSGQGLLHSVTEKRGNKLAWVSA